VKIAIILVLIGVVAIVHVACRRQVSQDPHSLSLVAESKYKPGQVWSFRSPPVQTIAVLTVLRIESNPKLGTIVHIALSGLSLPGGGTNIQHMPFAEQAIDKSVLTLVRENEPLPDFQNGYDEWRQAFEASKGGVFTTTVGVGFEAMRMAMTKPDNGMT
jgi:hypothetical protein